MTEETAPLSTRTTCPYCGVGCGVIAKVDPDGQVTISGDKEHPSNFGRLCSKGSALAETLDLEGRLLVPEINGREVEWNTALNLVAHTFQKTIAEHGPDSVAFYVSGQLLTEDYYVANKLMKGFMGSANIDTNSRLCMASSVAGHVRAFGSDTVPGCYEDLELADLIVITGSNLAWCHPVLYQRIVAAKEERPEMRVVVIDPRRTVTCDLANLHLPLRPDTDVALFLGLLRYLDTEGAVDEVYVDTHTEGFEDARNAAARVDLEAVAEQTGLAVTDIKTFYRWVRDTEKTVTVYSQGVNQSTTGTDKVNAIINTHLATGRIGRPGMGPFSVTGQPNAMGGREVGGLANQLAAHMQIENPAHRDLVQDFWKSPTIASKPGLKAVDLFQAIYDGKVKAVWIMATNPADSLPDAALVEQALENCPFVVVSDVLKQTDTTRHADVLLPATGWAEKDGTVTSSERRISRQRQFLKSPGKARPDWWALAEVGKRMGWAEHFSYPNPASIFREHARLSAAKNYGNRDFDIGFYAGALGSEYEELQPFQWPARTAGDSRKDATRLFADGTFYTPSGCARFVAVQAPTQIPQPQFVLNTGRVRDQWHTMTRTGKSAKLSAHLAEPYVEITKADADILGLDEAQLAEIYTDGHRVTARVLISDRQQAGTIFMPMHWTDQFTANGRVNTLVPADVDPVSGQPGLKSADVRLKPFVAQWYGFAVSGVLPAEIKCDYWAVSKAVNGWRLELAGLSVETDWVSFAEDLFGKWHDPQTWRTYIDSGKGIYRFAIIEDNRLVSALFLDRQPVAVSRAWVTGQLGQETTEISVLSGRASADRPDSGAVVCACFGVGINQITAAISESNCTTAAKIGEKLQAGTNCGSCLPELRALLRREQETRQAAE